MPFDPDSFRAKLTELGLQAVKDKLASRAFNGDGRKRDFATQWVKDQESELQRTHDENNRRRSFREGLAVALLGAVAGALATYALGSWGSTPDHPTELPLAPIMFEADITYLTDTQLQRDLWQEVFAQLLPVCTRTGDQDCPLSEIPISVTQDAHAEFFLVPKVDSAVGDATERDVVYRGYGFYTESINVPGGAGVVVEWVVRFESEPKSRAQLSAGTTILLRIDHQGQGRTIPFGMLLDISDDGVFGQDVKITYQGAEVASVTIRESARYSTRATG